VLLAEGGVGYVDSQTVALVEDLSVIEERTN
jgi:hypothetical protein